MADLPAARRTFAERLARAPLLVDGAMGTLLFSRGVPQRTALAALGETRPDLVGAIHPAYNAARADCIETHSFGANRLRLAPYGLGPPARRGHKPPPPRGRGGQPAAV
jgi:methionine synthase / methylenetetrahydrofolate reductase(NADPH)